MKYTFFIVAAIALLFNSCSIEKRKYQDGYHVEWHKSHKQTNSAEIHKKEEAVALVKQEEEIPELTVVKEKDPVLYTQEEAAGNEVYTAAGDDVLIVSERSFKNVGDTITPGDEYYTKSNEDSSINEHARQSKMFGLLGIGSLVGTIAFSSLMSVLYGAASILGYLISTLAVAALVFGIIAIVLADKAKKEIKILKGRYSNERDADVGSVLGWIIVGLYIAGVVIFILALLLIILLFAAMI